MERVYEPLWTLACVEGGRAHQTVLARAALPSSA